MDRTSENPLHRTNAYKTISEDEMLYHPNKPMPPRKMRKRGDRVQPSFTTEKRGPEYPNPYYIPDYVNRKAPPGKSPQHEVQSVHPLQANENNHVNVNHWMSNLPLQPLASPTRNHVNVNQRSNLPLHKPNEYTKEKPRRMTQSSMPANADPHYHYRIQNQHLKPTENDLASMHHRPSKPADGFQRPYHNYHQLDLEREQFRHAQSLKPEPSGSRTGARGRSSSISSRERARSTSSDYRAETRDDSASRHIPNYMRGPGLAPHDRHDGPGLAPHDRHDAHQRPWRPSVVARRHHDGQHPGSPRLSRPKHERTQQPDGGGQHNPGSLQQHTSAHHLRDEARTRNHLTNRVANHFLKYRGFKSATGRMNKNWQA